MHTRSALHTYFPSAEAYYRAGRLQVLVPSDRFTLLSLSFPHWKETFARKTSEACVGPLRCTDSAID